MEQIGAAFILLSELASASVHWVSISGDTLLWNNRRILVKPIIVLAQQAQSAHD